MELKLTRHDDHYVATPECASFATFGAEDYRKCFAPILGAIREKPMLVILDLEDVDYLRSSGLGVILAIRDEVHDLGGRLVVASPPVLCKHLFEIADVTDTVPVYGSVAEARAAETGG